MDEPEIANEQWRPVKGFEDSYEVSNCGRVRRVLGGQGAMAGKLLTPKIHSRGYLYVSLGVNGEKRRNFYIHRLVLEAFIGSSPTGCNSNHKDGNKKNNILSNLEYITIRKNNQHASYTGLLHWAKLSMKKAREIRKLGLLKILKYEEIAQIYGVSPTMIGKVIRNESWIEMQM